ncbi:MAG: tryptophan--tRNA ligase [Alphaproteobacteria bacterium]|jgi:tryptophanyl-tRNA synthetase|nr:tryptophan--tRNA ligase [Alphaproteobacteria bacterium]
MSGHQPLVFSGMQPTGNLHLGNYLGAIRNWLKLQEQYRCLYCMVDMHALTVDYDPKQLGQATREVMAAYLASGVDPKRSIVFAQSQVKEHAELAWVLNCVARIGWLNRMTQFKDKAGKNAEKMSVGLYTYPVLMAADILLYRATHVPVGEDQKQHVELARDIAQKFNNDLGVAGFFPIPEPIVQGPATRIMSLRDGTAKMSKSDPSEYSRINLTDDADTIATKFKKAKTDPLPLPETEKELEGRPEADNLVSIYAAFADKSTQAVLDEFKGGQFSTFKGALAELVVAKLSPIATEMRRLLADPAELDRLMLRGADQARAIAAPIMAEVRRVVGWVA